MERKQRKRVVVKIGSSSITDKSGRLSLDSLTRFVDDIAKIHSLGHEVLLVSSGAVAAGFKSLGYPARPVTLEGKQAAAAVGQGLLIETYNNLLQNHHHIAGQILLTREDFSNQERYQNARNTLTTLLKRGVIPIINENDTVSVDELTFGDNDMLSALVSGIIHADLLAICTDTNGLYTANPLFHADAEKLDFVPEITPDIEAIAGSSGSQVGTGGMKSKIEAAKVALTMGVEVFIGKHSTKKPLKQILEHSGDGTYFTASDHTLKSTKQWIAFHSGTQGRIYVDDGARRALLHQFKSLLLPGIVQVSGDFKPSDVVEVLDRKGHVIGRGKVQYASDEVRTYLKQRKKGTRFQKAVIHRDEWVSKKEELTYE